MIRGWSSDRTEDRRTELLGAVVGVVWAACRSGGAPRPTTRSRSRPTPGPSRPRAPARWPGTPYRWRRGVQVPGTGAGSVGPVVGDHRLWSPSSSRSPSGLVWAVARHRPRTVVALVAFVVAYPIIYSLLPGHLVLAGRAIHLVPALRLHRRGVLPLGCCVGAGSSTAATAVVVLGAALASTAELNTGSARAHPSARFPTHSSVKRISLAPLARALESHRIESAMPATGWRTTSISSRAGAAASRPPKSTRSGMPPTSPRAVAATARPAWILCEPGERPQVRGSCGQRAGRPTRRDVDFALIVAGARAGGSPTGPSRSKGFAGHRSRARKVTPVQLRQSVTEPGRGHDPTRAHRLDEQGVVLFGLIGVARRRIELMASSSTPPLPA